VFFRETKKNGCEADAVFIIAGHPRRDQERSEYSRSPSLTLPSRGGNNSQADAVFIIAGLPKRDHERSEYSPLPLPLPK
jgi:malate/lactate dehydrogenase